MLTLAGCSAPTAPPTRPTVAADHKDGGRETTGESGHHPRGCATAAGIRPRAAGRRPCRRRARAARPVDARGALAAAAHRQQAAYRAIGRHPEWDAITRPRIPPSLLDVYDRNVDARRQLTAMAHVKDTLPAWRIEPPAPAEELLGYYREAESDSGVGWNYLAAINLIETRFGSINGVSTAGAQGPMQFLPSTFAAYGRGRRHPLAPRQHHGGRPLPGRQWLRQRS